MRNKYKNLVALLVLLAATVLAVGAVFARYSTTVKKNLPFSVLDTEYLNICGTVDSKAETLPPAPASFQYAENGDARIAFSVVNAKSPADICENDMEFCISLTVTEGFDENGAVVLYLTEDGTITESSVPYVGKITKNEKGSAAYLEQGPGFVCRFFDNTGKEVVFNLSGGVLSAKNFVLSVNGSADVSLFRLSAVPVVK